MQSIYIRRECRPNEKRTPLNPKDVKLLISKNIMVYVQTSEYRIYKDSEYEQEGAHLTDKPWYAEEFKYTLIIGIKELNNLENLKNHTHMYFSHSYKNQSGSEYILEAFSKSNSILYDFEHFTNNSNNRIIAFGHCAGLVGGALGLKQYINRVKNLPDLGNLSCFTDIQSLCNLDIDISTPNVAVIGSKGRCGSGVIQILNTYKIPFTIFEKDDDITRLTDFDIVFNSILLDETYNKVWFDTQTVFKNPIVIVDISCDCVKKNNPIKLYSEATTWQNPVYKYSNLVDIIAIDNLPSLLPKISSDEFSSKCTDLIIMYGSEIWQRCFDKFDLAVKSIEKK
jgi:saccharopine dehydrogenase (NAD+, L-lysine-forming)